MANSEPTFKNITKDPLLWGLPEHLSRNVFKGTISVRLSVDQILFHAGDAGDGCYRVDDGLLKVTMLSPSGNERILCLLGPPWLAVVLDDSRSAVTINHHVISHPGARGSNVAYCVCFNLRQIQNQRHDSSLQFPSNHKCRNTKRRT